MFICGNAWGLPVWMSTSHPATAERSIIMTSSTPLTIRLAREDDRASLAILAQLDSGRAPAHPVLLAEADGGVVAAVSLLDGTSVADPFRPTADVVDLLRVRAAAASTDARASRGPRLGAAVRGAPPV
jgi:hypothetical protein